MRAHFDAIEALLSPLGWPVHLAQAAPGVTPPFIVLWGGSSPTGGLEDRLDGVRGDYAVRVGVTCTAGTPLGVLMMQEQVRPALCPGNKATRLTVPGYAAWLTPFDSRDIQIDRDATLTGATSSPAFGVDLYWLNSTPSREA